MEKDFLPFADNGDGDILGIRLKTRHVALFVHDAPVGTGSYHVTTHLMLGLYRLETKMNIDDDLSNRILRTLESLSQPNRIRYGLWVVERLLPSYVNLSKDMDWEVNATIELIHHALSDRIDDEEPDLDDIVSLVEQLPEGDEGCSPYWPNGLDYLCALHEICLGMVQCEPLPFAKMFQICCDQIDRDILNEVYGKSSGPHSPQEIANMNAMVTNHPRMALEISSHEGYLKSLDN